MARVTWALLICLVALACAQLMPPIDEEPKDPEIEAFDKIIMNAMDLLAADENRAEELFVSVYHAENSTMLQKREAAYRIAYILYNRRHLLADVFQYLSFASTSEDDNAPKAEDRLYHSGAGRIYQEQGMWSQSKWHYVQAVNLDEFDHTVNDHLNLMEVASHSNDTATIYATAVRCLRKSASLCATGIESAVNRFMETGKQYAVSSAVFDAIEDEKQEENNPWFWRMKGLNLVHQGRFGEAIYYHSKSLDVEGACKWREHCYYGRGMAAIQAGQCDIAHKDFLTVLLHTKGLNAKNASATPENLIVNWHFSGEHAKNSIVSDITDFVGVIGVHRPKSINKDFGLAQLPALYFEQQQAVVSHINDAWFEGESEIIHDGNGSLYLLGENGDANILQPVKPLDFSLPVIELERAAILNNLGHNYYHWTVEGLSRLVILLRDTFRIYPDMKLLVCKKKRYILESLELLGLDLEEQVEWYHYMDFRYHIKELYFADFRFPLDMPDNLDVDESLRMPIPTGVPVLPRAESLDTGLAIRQCVHAYFPPMQVLQELRLQLSTGSKMTYDTPTTILYVSRPNQHLRSVINEHILVQRLVDTFGRAVVVHTGGESTLQQAAMFHHASVVVGLHGAGLSNILYSQNVSALVEMPLLAPSFNFYAYLAVSLGMDYWVVPECATPYFQNLTMTEDLADIVVETVTRALYKSDDFPQVMASAVEEQRDIGTPIVIILSALAILFTYVTLTGKKRPNGNASKKHKRR